MRLSLQTQLSVEPAHLALRGRQGNRWSHLQGRFLDLTWSSPGSQA